MSFHIPHEFQPDNWRNGGGDGNSQYRNGGGGDRNFQYQNGGGGDRNSQYRDDGGGYSEIEEHFMPGIDVLFGYKLLNLSHYDFTKEKSNFFFTHPVFIKTVYFPAIEQDSINQKPINRNYYLVSVYDEDTNKDTVLNRRDLRRFYHFDSTAVVKTALIPTDYSVIRSQYDYQNDLMYIYARHDKNKHGSSESNEPIHIFWFSLKNPAVAKRVY